MRLGYYLQSAYRAHTTRLKMDDTEDVESSSLVSAGLGEMATDRIKLKMSERIRAVRPEVINFLSFLSVVWALLLEENMGAGTILFGVTGICILIIDVYFIHNQWLLQKNHRLPLLSCSWTRGRKVDELDDLLSDLPQSIWVLCYLVSYKFSLIAMVCALHSTFAVVEGLFKLND